MFVISPTSDRKVTVNGGPKELKKKRYCSYAIDFLEVRSGSKDAQWTERGHPYQSWFSGKALRSKGYPHWELTSKQEMAGGRIWRKCILDWRTQKL